MSLIAWQLTKKGYLRAKPMLNIFASYLYGSHEHGQPIVGNALMTRNVRMEDGMHTDWLSKEEAEAIASKLGKSVLRAVGDIRMWLSRRGCFDGLSVLCNSAPADAGLHSQRRVRGCISRRASPCRRNRQTGSGVMLSILVN